MKRKNDFSFVCNGIDAIALFWGGYPKANRMAKQDEYKIPILLSKIRGSENLQLIVENENGHVVYNSLFANIVSSLCVDIDTSLWTKGLHCLKIFDGDEILYHTMVYKYFRQWKFSVTIAID